MSQYPQYPPPYSEQPPVHFGYYQPAGDPRAPARRAAVMMFVLGALTLVLGGCFGVLAAVLPQAMAQAPPEQSQAIQEMERQLGGISVQTMLLIAAAVIGVGGILYVALGFWVRGGGRAAVITAIIFVGLATIYLVINTISALAMQGGAAGACVGVIGIGLHVPLVIWLVQALRASSQVAAMGQQGFQQPWQQQYPPPYPQQYPYPPQYGQPPSAGAAGYSQGGYGYGHGQRYGYGQSQPSPQQGQTGQPGEPPRQQPPDPPPA